MLADVDNSSAMNDSTASGEASVSSSGDQMAPKKAEKKKRNLPGMPGRFFHVAHNLCIPTCSFLYKLIVYILQIGYMWCGES